MPPSITTLTSRIGTRASGARNALYIDRGILVVNKPPGLVCQFNRNNEGKVENSVDSRDEDLQDFLGGLKDTFNLSEDPIPLHRLDKPTTGSLAFALNHRLAQDLSRQFRSREVQKTYLALVRGGARSFETAFGTIENMLSYHHGRFVVGKEELLEKKSEIEERKAKTDWTLVASSTKVPLTLLKFDLKTGLKHQLRIHAAQNLKAPILGDGIYGSKSLSANITDVVNIPNQYMYLHASQLSFYRYCPKRVRVEVVAPLPRYFVRLCAKIGIPLHIDIIKGGVWIDGVKMDDSQNGTERGDALDVPRLLDARWFV